MTTGQHILNLTTATVPTLRHSRASRQAQRFRATCSCGVEHGANMTRAQAHDLHRPHVDAANEQEQQELEGRR